MSITPLGIKAKLAEAKLLNKDRFLSDDVGQNLGWRLTLRCHPSGAGTWLFRYTHNGEREQIKLGLLKELDIPAARKATVPLADIYQVTTDVKGKIEADEQAKQAIIQAEREKIAEAQNQQEQKDKYTLAKMMTLYIGHLEKKGSKTSARDVVSLTKHLAPLANKPAAEITKKDLITVQRNLLDAGKGRTANKLRSYVGAAYALVLSAESDATAPVLASEFASTGGVEINPAALLSVAKGFNRARDRVLTNEELLYLIDHAQKSGAIGLAVRATIMLGGQRMAQLLRATLHDIQDGFLVLLDPKGRRDEPRKHPIPLEGKAGEVIKEAADRAKSLKTIWLFSTSGKVPIDPSTVTNYVSDVSVECISNRISTTPFDLGDIRRTIETRLSGMGISKDHRAQLQSHGLSGVQTRHYDRHEYEQEKRHALRVLYQLIESRGEQSAEILPLKRANRIKYRRYVTDLRGM